MELNRIYNTDCLEGLKTLPDNYVDCCPSSPPYWGLRDYGIEKSNWPEVRFILFGFEIVVPEMECCLGLEDKPEWFIGHMVLIYREVKRVLKKEGTCWINIGDSYATTAPGNTKKSDSCVCNATVVLSIILDMFMGAGTTALVSAKLNRNFIGFELNKNYIEIAHKRLMDELGMFNPLK